MSNLRSALVTHGWLDNPLEGYSVGGECRRAERFLHHYQMGIPTYILDNGSKLDSCMSFGFKHGVPVVNLQPHYKRGGVIGIDHDYKNVWRAYWKLKEMLGTYDRIFYIATDARIISQRLMDYLWGITQGWVTLWCPQYQCPASEIQVITRDCEAFENFFAGPEDVDKYNGLWEEVTLPFTHVEKGFNGDRYGEFQPKKPYMPYRFYDDYYTQVPDGMDFPDAQFPVVRKVGDKLVVAMI